MDGFRKFLVEQETTLRHHDKLNPAIWQGESLRPGVRDHLVKIADAWREYAGIPKAAVKDVLLVGGNANYNYTKYSDLDVHLLVDKEKMPECTAEIIDDYLKDKKTLWSLSHDIKIHGYPVELYAQGLDEPTSPDQGVYSLSRGEWSKKPSRKRVSLKDPLVAKKAKRYMDTIDGFISSKSDSVERMEALKTRLREMRKAAVRSGGEFSLENLVFKELRNRGYIDKLTDYIRNVEDHRLSLP